jgi:hypothetical protein
MPTLQATLTHLPNPAACPTATYPLALQQITSLKQAGAALANISS